MLEGLRRRWLWRRLRDRKYEFLFEADPAAELVSIDCETTSLHVGRAELLSFAAIKVRGNRILTSQSLELVVRTQVAPSPQNILVHQLRPLDVERGVAVDEAIERLLGFIGGRLLLGYYLEFDVAVLNKYVKPRLGIPLPNRQIEVSALYYDARSRHLPPGSHIDLRFATICRELDLPEHAAHDPFNDALLAAMIYLRLTGPHPKLGRSRQAPVPQRRGVASDRPSPR
jgi:DNA polymerase III subunit epsilon